MNATLKNHVFPMKTLMKYAGIVLAFLCLSGASWGQATKHPFLWRIDSLKGNPLKTDSWLYGTMHLGDKRLVTLPHVVTEAIKGADALYCEVEMGGDQAAAQQMMLAKMMHPAGTTIESELPKDLYARLKKGMEKRGYPMAAINQFRLWSLELLLPMLDAQKNGMTHFLDETIYKMAEKQKKEVGGLEKVPDQLSVFASSTPEQQVEGLRMALDLMDKLDAKGTTSIKSILEVYLRGDVEELLDITIEFMGNDKEKTEARMKSLVYDRNIGMANGMAEMMTKHPGKSYFFAVGAMHCPGKKSVIELLEKKGFKLTRVNAPAKRKSKDTGLPTSKPESRPTSQPTSSPAK
ncbi:MAG: hypothetical protein ACI97A_003668 [Planctomycetota bacterium]